MVKEVGHDLAFQLVDVVHGALLPVVPGGEHIQEGGIAIVGLYPHDAVLCEFVQISEILFAYIPKQYITVGIGQGKERIPSL